MKKIVIEAFLYLGGATLVLGVMRKAVPSVISKLFGALLLNPTLRSTIISHRKEIEDIFDEIDQQVKKDLEDAAQQNPNG